MPNSQTLSGGSGFGWDVSVSGDGLTAAVSDASNQVLIYILSGGAWTLEQTLSGGTGFGQCVRLSEDGNTLAVSTVNGAFLTGPGNAGLGNVDVFVRSSGSWSNQFSVGPPDASSTTWGLSIDISSDGNTLVAGDPYAFGQDGGAWIYFRTGTSWASQSGRLVPTDTSLQPYQFGWGVALSGDGDTAIVGGPNFRPTLGAPSGAFWQYDRAGSWTLTAGPIRQPSGTSSVFGRNLHISTDGLTAIVNRGDFTPSGSEPTIWVFTRSVGGSFSDSGSYDLGIKSQERTSWGALSGDGTRILAGKWFQQSVKPFARSDPRVITGNDLVALWGGPIPTVTVGSGLGFSGELSDDGFAYIVGGNGAAYIYWEDSADVGEAHLVETVDITTTTKGPLRELVTITTEGTVTSAFPFPFRVSAKFPRT